MVSKCAQFGSFKVLSIFPSVSFTLAVCWRLIDLMSLYIPVQCDIDGLSFGHTMGFSIHLIVFHGIFYGL